MRIIENQGGVCDGQIFNIGNPANECSSRNSPKNWSGSFNARKARIPNLVPARIEGVDADTYYGKGYQDILTRKPSIEKAKAILGWEPVTDLTTSLAITLDSFLEEAKAGQI